MDRTINKIYWQDQGFTWRWSWKITVAISFAKWKNIVQPFLFGTISAAQHTTSNRYNRYALPYLFSHRSKAACEIVGQCYCSATGAIYSKAYIPHSGDSFDLHTAHGFYKTWSAEICQSLETSTQRVASQGFNFYYSTITHHFWSPWKKIGQ